MQFNIIAAVAQNGVIGNQGKLPWGRIGEDLSHFRRKTVGHPVIMGRKTWESLGSKPLNDRPCYVVSSDRGPTVSDGDVTWVQSLDAALDDISTREDISQRAWVIGGGQLYEEALRHRKANKLYLTEVHLECEGDVHFPTFDDRRWVEVSKEPGYDGKSQTYLTFKTYAAKVLID